MKISEVAKLAQGLYRIKWKRGEGTSIAAVGSDACGNLWLAPTNWIAPVFGLDAKKAWRDVDSVVMICSSAPSAANPASWVSPKHKLPDDDALVLLRLNDEEYPIVLGWHDANAWIQEDGSTIESEVLGWMHPDRAVDILDGHTKGAQ